MIKVVFDLYNKHQGYISSDCLDNIREHFSVENPTAKFSKFKGARFIPSRKYAITPAGKFDIGMLDEIQNYLTSLQIPYTSVITDPLKEQFKPSYNIKQLSTLNKEARDYQVETLNNCLSNGRGTVVIGTAGGKTLTMALLTKTISDNIKNTKTLIIVPTLQLVEQTYNDFIEYGIDTKTITKWSGNNKPDFSASIIVVGSNILHSKNTDLSILKEISLLLIDECHHIKKSNEISDLLKQINTPHIFGFTGSLPDNKMDEWSIIGKIGPIVFKKSSYELREENYVAPVLIKIIKIKYKEKPFFLRESKTFKPSEIYNKENDYLYGNEHRNNIIATLCQKLDKNILILVDRIEHGNILNEIIKKLNPTKKVYFIQGDVEMEEREKMRALMEIDDNIVCIAISKIFSTGINIKNLHYIMFALIGKASIKIIQSIGRGLRLHENKQKLVIFDIADCLYYSEKHLLRRQELYEKEKINYEIKEFRED